MVSQNGIDYLMTQFLSNSESHFLIVGTALLQTALEEETRRRHRCVATVFFCAAKIFSDKWKATHAET